MEKKLIFDIGAHTGKDTQFYLRKGFRVVAIEAYGPHAQHIRSQLAEDILQGNLAIEEVGIGQSTGIGSFYVHETVSYWHRSDIALDHPSADKLTEIFISYTDAPSLFAKYDVPYYMKVDIEDSDWLVIMAINAAYKPTFISFEWGYNYGECLQHLSSVGYNSFQIVDQSKNNKTIPPFPSREGRFVDAKFDEHMSGLFGFELPDRWKDFDVIKNLAVRLDSSKGRWYDFHASVLPHKGGSLATQGVVGRRQGSSQRLLHQVAMWRRGLRRRIDRS